MSASPLSNVRILFCHDDLAGAVQATQRTTRILKQANWTFRVVSFIQVVFTISVLPARHNKLKYFTNPCVRHTVMEVRSAVKSVKFKKRFLEIQNVIQLNIQCYSYVQIAAVVNPSFIDRIVRSVTT